MLKDRKTGRQEDRISTESGSNENIINNSLHLYHSFHGIGDVYKICFIG